MRNVSERELAIEARKALGRMSDAPRGWKDPTTYRKISIPQEMQLTLRRLGSGTDHDGRFTRTFNRLDRRKNVGSFQP